MKLDSKILVLLFLISAVYYCSCSIPVIRTSCPRLSLFVELPAGCPNTMYDVGRCSRYICGSPGYRRTCCDIERTETVSIMCGGRPIPIDRVVTCICKRCSELLVTVTGTLRVQNNPTQSGSGAIIRRSTGEELAITSTDGFFMFRIPYNSLNTDIVISIEFGGTSPRFMNSIQTLNIGMSDRAHFDLLVRGEFSFATFPSGTGMSFPFTSSAGNQMIVISIPPNSITFTDNTTYSGQVAVFGIFQNPSDESAIGLGASQIFASGSPPVFLASYGLFRLNLFSENMVSSLTATRGQIRFPISLIPRIEDVAAMRLWNQNPITGLFDQDVALTVSGNDLTANFTGSSQVLRNLDVPVATYCHLKVGAFGSNMFSTSLLAVRIRAVYRDSNGNWRGFIDVTTSVLFGACIPIPCTTGSSVISSVVFTGTDILMPLSTVPGITANLGVGSAVATSLNYSSSGNQFSITLPVTSVVNDVSGPVFSSSRICGMSTLTQAEEFRFFRPRGSTPFMELNAVYIDEYNIPETWRPNPLAWWPLSSEFAACYMKIQTRLSWSITIRAISYNQEITPTTVYGVRVEKIDEPTTVCVEYKCPRPFDRTFVEVGQDGPFSCPFSAFNSALLASYPSDPLNSVPTVGGIVFGMFAPTDIRGRGYGLYTASSGDPVFSKQTAKTECLLSTVPFALQLTCSPVSGV